MATPKIKYRLKAAWWVLRGKPLIYMAAERYDGHGDLDLTRVERALLRATGFESWGNHGWIKDEENGATCYDDRWALREALAAPLPEGGEER